MTQKSYLNEQVPFVDPRIISLLIFSYLNSVDDEGRTPLMLAIKKQNIYIIKHLLAKGASKICVDKKGNTVFHYAANTNKDVVKVHFTI